MRFSVILAAVVLAAALGAANNLLTAAPVPWLGSPEVLVQNPWDVIHEPHLKGVRAALRYSAAGLRENAAAIAVGAFVVVAASVAARRRGVRGAELADLWFRLAMAAMLLAACVYKLQRPADFAEAVAQYQLLPKALVDPLALWLPALELVVAVGLLASPFAREMFTLLALMWGMFIAALTWAIARRLGITCGCFALREGYGNVGEAWFSLLRDLVLLPPILWLALRAGQRPLWALLRLRRPEAEPAAAP